MTHLERNFIILIQLNFIVYFIFSFYTSFGKIFKLIKQYFSFNLMIYYHKIINLIDQEIHYYDIQLIFL
jgi:hypothetical protein